MVTPAKSKADRAKTAGDGAKSRGSDASGARGSGTLFTTGEMARLSDNTLRTVRFYEEAGILTPVRRTDGGHRLFEQPELERLMLVTDMRAAGMSLDEIRRVLELKSKALSGAAAARGIGDALQAEIAGLEDKMARLDRLRADLIGTLRVVEHCLHCDDEPGADGFPDSCEQCAKIGEPSELPRAMRVLWSLRDAPSSAAKRAQAGSQANGDPSDKTGAKASKPDSGTA